MECIKRLYQWFMEFSQDVELCKLERGLGNDLNFER